MAKIALKYKGNGFYTGVPARDLSDKEVKQYGLDFLLSLGLYEETYKPKLEKVEEIKPEKVEED